MKKSKKKKELEENILEQGDSTEFKTPIPTFKAVLQNGIILIKNPDALQEFFNKSYIGTKLADKSLELSYEESFLLMERERIELYLPDGTKLTPPEFISQIGKIKKDIWLKYLVYRDLRQRGYIVRQGFGEGIDFRVFPRGGTRSEDIAKHFIFILDESNPVRLEKLHKITLQALKDRKELILAVVDRLGEPTYYSLDQFNLPMNKKKEMNW
jgi:tRNA-intron endonuclease